MLYESLDWWWDPVPREGPEAMAVDDWLFERAERPTLRVYRWAGPWGSVGYFGSLDLARRRIPEVQWVRRRTGGGVVDHTADWTYTVIVPKSDPVAGLRGGESYRVLHETLAMVLRGEGFAVTTTEATGSAGEELCFRNPVSHDLMLDGKKIAGAGQRRTRSGLLHQGSVALVCAPESSKVRARALAEALCSRCREISITLPIEDIRRRAACFETIR